MKLIVTAAEILAAIGTDEADPNLKAFAEDYHGLRAQRLTHRQIAAKLGVSINVVKHRLAQARQAGLIQAQTPRPKQTRAPRPAAPDRQAFISAWRDRNAVNA